VVPPRDAPALADALNKLSNDRSLARRLGEGGRARFHAHFSIERSTDVLQSVYERVLGRVTETEAIAEGSHG
jgi:glycosyltransferase involved in cell wall biosynthesis